MVLAFGCDPRHRGLVRSSLGSCLAPVGQAGGRRWGHERACPLPRGHGSSTSNCGHKFTMCSPLAPRRPPMAPVALLDELRAGAQPSDGGDRCAWRGRHPDLAEGLRDTHRCRPFSVFTSHRFVIHEKVPKSRHFRERTSSNAWAEQGHVADERERTKLASCPCRSWKVYTVRQEDYR